MLSHVTCIVSITCSVNGARSQNRPLQFCILAFVKCIKYREIDTNMKKKKKFIFKIQQAIKPMRIYTNIYIIWWQGQYCHYDLSIIYRIEILEHHDRTTEKVFKARTIYVAQILDEIY